MCIISNTDRAPEEKTTTVSFSRRNDSSEAISLPTFTSRADNDARYLPTTRLVAGAAPTIRTCGRAPMGMRACKTRLSTCVLNCREASQLECVVLSGSSFKASTTQQPLEKATSGKQHLRKLPLLQRGVSLPAGDALQTVTGSSQPGC
eukprot:1803757-Pleurochrysis_carterae.AAC.2